MSVEWVNIKGCLIFTTLGLNPGSAKSYQWNVGLIQTHLAMTGLVKRSNKKNNPDIFSTKLEKLKITNFLLLRIFLHLSSERLPNPFWIFVFANTFRIDDCCKKIISSR